MSRSRPLAVLLTALAAAMLGTAGSASASASGETAPKALAGVALGPAASASAETAPKALAGVVLGAGGSATASAQTAPKALAVAKVVADPDAGLLHLTVTCRATKPRCRGTLWIESEYDGPVTKRRSIALVPKRATRLTLRLAHGGLAAAGASGSETYGYLRLQPRAGKALEQLTEIDVQVGCRTGTTLASTAKTRVFEQPGSGVYACRLPSGKPMFIAETTESDLDSIAIGGVVIAEPYVAYVEDESYKCSGSSVGLFDLNRHAVVVERSSSEDPRPWANCQGTVPIFSVVLRPSGAFAWLEGFPGSYAVRAVDATGTHTLGNGTTIDPSSFRLDGDDGVAWLDGSTPQRATLR